MAATADMEDENRGPKILGVLWALTSLTTVVVVARMYIRIRMLKNFGSDDWLIALSMVRMLLQDRVPFAELTSQVYGTGILRYHHSKRRRGIWKTCYLSDGECDGDGSSAQYR